MTKKKAPSNFRVCVGPAIKKLPNSRFTGSQCPAINQKHLEGSIFRVFFWFFLVGCTPGLGLGMDRMSPLNYKTGWNKLEYAGTCWNRLG